MFAPVTSSDASERTSGPINFLSRVKRMRGLNIRERDSRPKGGNSRLGSGLVSESVANKSVRDNGLRSHLRYC